VRIADVVLRQGHLSEEALTEALVTGVRPEHLDACSLCAERALDLSRWLDEIRTMGIEAADEAFPPEKLAAQQSQIMRRLEQIDEPARVIAFPATTAPARREHGLRRVSPAWVGVAAAAGLVIGVIGGQVSARLDPTTAAGAAPTRPAEQIQTTAPATMLDATPVNASLMELNLEGYTPELLQGIDEMVPKLVPGRYTVASAK